MQTEEDHKARPRLSRRRFLRGAGTLGIGLLLGAACRGGSQAPGSTLSRAIVLDTGGNLVYGPGEPYLVRTDLMQAKAGREKRRRALATFHHLSDFRITDEESPLRSEWVEGCAAPISTSAFRPQESLSLQAAAALISQANRLDRSPATGAAVQFAIHTGNAADNAQYNELRWFLHLMDGNPVLPDSGSEGYQGVQQESPAPAYPDLLAQAQLPFRPEAIRYPWYTVLGNHDVLAQGNIPATDAARSIAVGGEKVMKVGERALEQLCENPSALLEPGSSDRILSDPETVVAQVTGDALRRLLSRKEWVEEHFLTATAPGPLGHGLSEENRAAGTAYYSVDFGDVLLLVLDTTNPGGFAAGSIDKTQFQWLEAQLMAHSSVYYDPAGVRQAATNRDRLIIIASNHGLKAMNNPFPDPAANEERFRGPELQAMLHRFPNVVLHLTGHSLAHRVIARPHPENRTQGYWEVSTGSPLDYPMQGRLLDITDNGDGTISIFSTVYDSAASIVPGHSDDPTGDDGVNQMELASIARQLAVRDPQRDPEASGLGPSDRNVELLLAAPFDLQSAG